jgi:hypothetical protein
MEVLAPRVCRPFHLDFVHDYRVEFHCEVQLGELVIDPGDILLLMGFLWRVDAAPEGKQQAAGELAYRTDR